MKVVYFYNFTDEEFAGSWNSEPTVVAAKAKVPMEDWRAAHFAKHLANREVLKLPGGDSHTSPKFPEQDPFFYDLYKQAIVDLPTVTDVKPENIELELAKETAKAPVKSKTAAKSKAKVADKTTKQADEDSFEGLKED